MATKLPSKSTLYFDLKHLYLSNELSDPQFLMLESDKQVQSLVFVLLPLFFMANMYFNGSLAYSV